MTVETDTLECVIRFRTARTIVDPSFAGNKQRIDTFLADIDRIEKDSLAQIESIQIKGSASPEGPQRLNERLSEKRALAVKNYLGTRMSIDNAKLSIHGVGEDYDMLAQMVDTCGQPWATEMAKILRETPMWIFDKSGKIVDGKKRQMMRLDRGNAYRWMFKHLFPALRSGINVVKCTIKRITPAPVVSEPIDIVPDLGESVGDSLAVESDISKDIEQDSIASPVADVPEIEDSLSAEHIKSGLPIALHTNLLYDIIAIPNIGMEIYVGKHLSVAANWHYAWWESDKHKRHWKTYGGYAALRYWLNNKPLNEAESGTPFRGHHLGLYGQILLYNFEWGDKGYMSGDEMKDIFSNPTWGGGLEYGYTMPLSKRLSMDFTAGLGYLQGRYYEYKPIDTHYVWQATKQRHYFGLTKLEVNLIWLIGRGNTNMGKGGAK